MTVFQKPLVSSVCIIVRRREFVFRCLPVVNGNHNRAHSIGQRPRSGIISIQIRDHPTATMDVENDWERTVPLRLINTAFDVSVAEFDVKVLNHADRLRRVLVVLLENRHHCIRR